MPNIRPVSDLRNNFKKISELCHEEGEPVFLTKNGKGEIMVAQQFRTASSRSSGSAAPSKRNTHLYI